MPPESDVADAVLASSKPKSCTAPHPPSSPGKRRAGTCHYSDVECNPSKKRDSGDRKEPSEFLEKGLLFADSTNTAGVEKGSGLDMGEIRPKLNRCTSKAKVEVVIEVPRVAMRRVRSKTVKA